MRQRPVQCCCCSPQYPGCPLAHIALAAAHIIKSPISAFRPFQYLIWEVTAASLHGIIQSAGNVSWARVKHKRCSTPPQQKCWPAPQSHLQCNPELRCGWPQTSILHLRRSSAGLLLQLSSWSAQKVVVRRKERQSAGEAGTARRILQQTPASKTHFMCMMHYHPLFSEQGKVASLYLSKRGGHGNARCCTVRTTQKYSFFSYKCSTCRYALVASCLNTCRIWMWRARLGPPMWPGPVKTDAAESACQILIVL